ncbi:MAG: porin [Paracoccaceae bacterium]
MKRTLLATTAIVAIGGAAYADVSLSGYAEMGIKGGSGMETQFHDDIDVSFSLSGTTDNGLTFGAKIDLDEADTGRFTGGGSQFNAVFISGAFGTLTLGDTDGAFDKAMIEVGAATSLTDDHTTHSGYNGNSGLDGTNDAQILRYDYSFGDFAIAASLELDDAGTSDVFGVGGSFKTDVGGTAVGFGVGYQTVDGGADIWGVSASAGISGGIKGVVNYSDHSTKGQHTAVGLTYSMDAITVHGNYGTWNGGTMDGISGLGVAFNYDLSGGLVLMAGYGNTDPAGGGANVDTWSVGFGMSF